MAQMNPTQLNIDNGKKALMRHEINQAFDHLFLPALEDDEAKRLFLMIINTRCRLFILNEQQVATLKDYAEKGFALAQYAYGRYLEALRPDANALNTANEYFKSAEKAGLGDALYIQAILFNSGHYGLIDLEESKRMIEEALDMGSVLAERYFLKGYIYGRRDVEADPQKAIDILQAMFNGNESDDISVVDPSNYHLLGDAYSQLDEYENAEKYYLKAIQMGFNEAFSDYCLLFQPDDIDDEGEEKYENLLDLGCNSGDPSCYVYRAAIYMDNYDRYDEATQKKMTEKIREDLTTASELGSDLASEFLGEAYHYERYGFEKNDVKAWNWFLEGTHRDNGDAFKMLALMIADEDNPHDVPDGFVDYCVMMALRNGCDALLDTVVEGYRDGELTDYAAEIERYYIPRYDSLHHDDEDEDENDDEDFDDPDLKLIAIIKTNGKADIIEFDVEEGWDELPDHVGARRLDAIRVQPLYDISDQLGYEDHITGWVDTMGLLKDLPMNPVGCKIYPGPIAGDMILTLESKKYEPKSFESLNDLKKVISALGATLEHISLDDGPDDDGRFDAYV